jgi:hypothetical protein
MVFTLLNMNLILNFTKKSTHVGNKISKAFLPWNFTLNIFHVLHKTVWYAVGEQFICDRSSMSVHMKGHTQTQCVVL